MGLLQACGGGGGAEKTEMMASAIIDNTKQIAATATDVPATTLSVVSLTKVSETRINRTTYDYVFKITVKNSGQDYAGVKAKIVSAGQGVTVIDGDVAVGDLAAGASATPTDTITLRQDRTHQFNQADLVWNFTGTPSGPPLLAGAWLSGEPAGRASMNQLYESKIYFSPIDSRNIINSLQAKNLTDGGSIPSITTAGNILWTPNSADFATRALRYTVGLSDGSSTTFDVPITVTSIRSVAQITLSGRRRYSDDYGRYLVDVSAKDSAIPVTGTLYISERFDASGVYTYVITTTNSNNEIAVIKFPTSTASVSTATPVVDIPSSRVKAAASKLSALSEVPFKLSIVKTKYGQKIDDGYNIYTTRTEAAKSIVQVCNEVVGSGVAGSTPVRTQQCYGKEVFLPHDVARIDSNCDYEIENSCNVEKYSATPIILVHGFTPEPSPIGGGTGTWGGLSANLNDKHHAVFELRYYSQMRFEEVAGILTTLANDISRATGKKPFIIAHSFGGIVAHLALSGNAETWIPSENTWVKASFGNSSSPLLSGLITLGSPLSGINGNNNSLDFLVGRYHQDFMIAACMSIECVQAGASDNSLLIEKLRVNSSKIGASLSSGESIVSIRNAWLANGRGNAISLPVEKIHTVISLIRRPNDGINLTAATSYKLGDGLISMAGQAVLAADFNCQNSNNQQAYDFQGCLSGNTVIGDFFETIEKNADLNQSRFHIKINQRNYHFTSRARHTFWQREFSAGYDAFNIAEYQSTVPLKINSTGFHPLQFFIDGILADTPVLAATVNGVAVVSGTIKALAKGAPTPLAHGFQITANIIKSTNELPDRSSRTIVPNSDGSFSIDAAQWVRSTATVFPVDLSQYRLRLDFGDGETYLPKTITTAALNSLARNLNLGTIEVNALPRQNFVDQFDDTTIDLIKWTPRSWSPGFGTAFLTGGLLHIDNCQYVDTKDKYVFAGSKIVIETRFAGQKYWGRDTGFSLVNTLTSERVHVGDTNYRGFGVYVNLTKSGVDEFFQQFGGTTSAFKAYRITFQGANLTIERGDSIDKLSEKYTSVLPINVTNSTYYLELNTGGCDGYYSPADFDWINVRVD